MPVICWAKLTEQARANGSQSSRARNNLPRPQASLSIDVVVLVDAVVAEVVGVVLGDVLEVSKLSSSFLPSPYM